MPPVLVSHDVLEEDWDRLIQDVALAWAGKLPLPDNNGPLERTTLVGDLADLWNKSFFLIRNVELVLYRGRERRSGSRTGIVDRDLPLYDKTDDYGITSSEDSEELENSDLEYTGGYAAAHNNPRQQLAEVLEAGRLREEAKKAAREERRRRRQERNRIRREKRQERVYALYLMYVPTRVGRGSGYASSGGQGGGGYGMSGRY